MEGDCLQASMVENVRLLESTDLENAANLMGRSFQNDPFTEYIVPDPVTRAKIMPRFYRVFLKSSMRNHQAYAVSPPLQGVAIWIFPCQKRIDIAGLFLAGLPMLIFQGFFFPFLRAIKIFIIIGNLQKKYVQKSDYYLNTLAVAPDSQGQGFGSKLVKPFLKKADITSKSVYVETMTLCDVKIYKHFGFQIKEEHPIRKGFSIWALYRPASSK